MKKAIVIMSLMLAAIAVAGVVVFIMSRPPETVFYSFETVEQMTCNIADKKIVRLTPFLKVSGTGHDQFLEDRENVICNSILLTLKDKTEEQLSDSLFVESLSDEILVRLSHEIDISFIKGVYFSEFFVM
jgi:flagellar basal body-associated protein FliL